MGSELAIEATGLGKAYRLYRRPRDRLWQLLGRRGPAGDNEFWALRDVSLQIARGETVGIIGRNGSGKSTLLELICGTVAPSCGDLSVQGRVAALLELGTGFNPEFTGRENIRIAAGLLGLVPAEIERRLPAIQAFADIGGFVDQPVKVYSSGMYARLAFAVAAHVDAEILLVDEILAVGDAAFAQKCFRFIRAFQRQGTLLLVSHDTGQIVNLCQRAVWLDQGRVREIGPAREVCYSYLADAFRQRDPGRSFHQGGNRRRPLEPVTDCRTTGQEPAALGSPMTISGFDPDGPWFGQTGARITDVQLKDTVGRRLIALEGGEEVVLEIKGVAERPIGSLITGFFVKDRLGQNLFGDNTWNIRQSQPAASAAGQRFVARFRFQMPWLPAGEYSVAAAIADGSQEDHAHLHWHDDSLFFTVHSSHVAGGLVGIPMLAIDLEIGDRATEPPPAPGN